MIRHPSSTVSTSQHPLYAALKELGRVQKSDFILRYVDVLEFRQAIEKQLNRSEDSNKFSKAVSFGNNHNFLYGEYYFSGQKIDDSVGLQTPKILALSVVEKLKKSTSRQ